MFIRVNYDGYGDGSLGAPPASFKKGGLPVGEDDAHHLLTILEGRSSFQPYLARAMAQRATTVPKKFLKIVTSVSSQVPKNLRRVFTSGGGRMTGGTIDRWTRIIYMVEAPGLRDHTRLDTRCTNACTCLRIRMRRRSRHARNRASDRFKTSSARALVKA